MARSVMWNAGVLAAISVLALSGAAVARQQPAAPATPAQTAPAVQIPVTIVPQNIDLGDMMPETKKMGEVMITNVGSTPLKILEVRSTCNCTVPELPEKVIQPGATVPLRATFESPQYMGPVRRNVYVFFEGYGQPVKIDIDSRVNYGVKAIVKYVPEGQYRLGEFTLEDIMGRPFRVLAANRQPPVFLDGFDPAKDPPRSKYVVKVDLQNIPEAELPKWFMVELDHPTAAVVDMRIIRGDPKAPKPVSGGWQLSHERVLMWQMKPGASKEIGVVLKNLNPGLPADIDKLRPSNDQVKATFVRFEQTPEGPKAIIRIDTNAESSGLLFSTITMATQGTEQTFDLIGRFVP